MVTDLKILRKLKHKLVMVEMRDAMLFHYSRSQEYEIQGTFEG